MKTQVKKLSYSHFSQSCNKCSMQNFCISGGAFHTGLRQYFLRLKGYEYPANEAMLKGKQRHEEYQKDMLTLDEYGLDNFIRDLTSEKFIRLKELPICAPKYGLKGVIDEVTFHFVKERNTLVINITELKSNFNKKYIYQIALYGLCLGDQTRQIGYQKKYKRPRPEKKARIMQKLELPEGLLLDVYLKLKIFDGGEYNQTWMKSNVMTDWANVMTPLLITRKKNYKNFHRAGLYWLHELPECLRCDSKCPYYRICSKFEYKPHKDKQRYFGKRANRPIIKTKPKFI